MQNLSSLVQSNTSNAKLDGKSDIRQSLFEAGFIEDAAKQQGMTNFADVLANELGLETPELVIKNPVSSEPLVDGEPAEIVDERTSDVGAIASLFLGQTEAGQLVTKAEIMPLKEGVASALAMRSEARHKVDNMDKNQLLNDEDTMRNPLGDSTKVEATSVKVSYRLQANPLSQPYQTMREVDRNVLEASALKSKITTAVEPKLDNMTSVFKVEQSATFSSMTQSMLATENSMQKVAGENHSSNHINTPFSNPNWAQAVQQKVLWMVGAVDKSATLTLNPPELGPLKVVVSVDNQAVDTTFISESPEVRQTLQDSMAALKDRMLESGIQLGQTNIGNNAQSEQAFQQSQKQNNGSVKTLGNGDESTLQDGASEAGQTIITQTGDGLVDTFV